MEIVYVTQQNTFSLCTKQVVQILFYSNPLKIIGNKIKKKERSQSQNINNIPNKKYVYNTLAFILIVGRKSATGRLAGTPIFFFNA